MSDTRYSDPADQHDHFTGLISTEVPRYPVGTSAGRYSDVSGNWVVWTEGSTLYAYNELTREQRSIVTSTPTPNAPRINGDLIAWDDSQAGGPGDVFVYSISAAQTRLISSDSSPETVVGVDNGYIAFTKAYFVFPSAELPNSPPYASNLWLYNWASAALTNVTNFTDPGYHLSKESVATYDIDFGGGRLVWSEQTRIWVSSSGYWGSNNDRVKTMTLGGSPTTTPVPTYYTHVATDGARIVWSKTVSGRCQVFLWDGTFDDPGVNTIHAPIIILDKQICGPTISGVTVAEYNGNGDGMIESNEQVKVSWTLNDPTGIASTQLTVDGSAAGQIYGLGGGNPVSANCYAILDPLKPGYPTFTITATNADISPDTSPPFAVQSHVYVAAAIWSGDGTDGKWSTAANWGGVSLVATAPLNFTGSKRLSNTNDFPSATQFNGITFQANAGAFVLGGNSIALSGDIVSSSSNLQTIALPLVVVGGNCTLNVGTGGLKITQAISESGGRYGIAKTGPGTLILSGANSYSGGTVVSSGKVIVSAPSALADGSALTVGNGALFNTPAPPIGTSVASSDDSVAIADVNSIEETRASKMPVGYSVVDGPVRWNTRTMISLTAIPPTKRGIAVDRVLQAVFVQKRSAGMGHSGDLPRSAQRGAARQVRLPEMATSWESFDKTKRQARMEACDAVLAEYGKSR